MIRTPEELAGELQHAVVFGTAGEARTSAVVKTACMAPPVWVFTVETVEGAKFRVSVTEEPK